jgi:hypothetical protein
VAGVQEEEDEQDEDEDLGIDEDRLAPMQAAAGDNTAHSSGRSSTVQAWPHRSSYLPFCRLAIVGSAI